MKPLLGQLARFAVVGVLGIGAYLGLAAVLLRVVGPQAGSLLARLLVAVPTSWLNVRVTFRSNISLLRAYLGGLTGLALGALLAASTLVALGVVDPDPKAGADLAALAAAQVVAAAARFVVLRHVALPAKPQSTPTELRAPAPTMGWPEGDPRRPLTTTEARS